MSKELVKASLCGAGIIGSAILIRQLDRYNRKKEYETLLKEMKVWYPKIIVERLIDVDENSIKEMNLDKSKLWKYVYTNENIGYMKDMLIPTMIDGIEHNRW